MFLLLPLRQTPGALLRPNADDESPCLALPAFAFEISHACNAFWMRQTRRYRL